MPLVQLNQIIKECTACNLRGGCNQVVTGVGNYTFPLLIIGEAPGADEDLFGEPFVGRAGKLLNKLLEGAGINRESVYITNTVKCRPKNNSVPKPSEIAACKSWLWQEIKELKPKAILTLGKISTGLLLKLKPNFKMKDVIGREHSVLYTDGKIMPWYHPSYLLHRGITWDQDTVDFFKKVKEQVCN